MNSVFEVYKVGGALSMLNLIYKLHYLRKDGCEVKYVGCDDTKDDLFYISVTKNGSTVANYRIALRSNDKNIRTESPIDEHFVYTDLPTRLSNEFNYSDFINVLNIYGRLCTMITLFLMTGRECYKRYEKYDSMLYTFTGYMTDTMVESFMMKYIIGDNRDNLDIYRNLVRGFQECVNSAVNKLRYKTDKDVPGKGMMKTLIYHSVLFNSFSALAAMVNDPDKAKYTLTSWNPDSIVETMFGKEIDPQLKYVASETFILAGYLTEHMKMITGMETGSYSNFFDPIIGLGKSAEKKVGETDEMGVIIDGEQTNFEFIDSVILKTKGKINFDFDKSKLCFRCSKHYICYLYGFSGMAYARGEESLFNRNVLETYSNTIYDIIKGKGSDGEKYIVEQIINRISKLIYEMNPYIICEKSFERLISYGSILRKIVKNSNGNIASSALIGFSYVNVAILYYLNMWFLNDQTRNGTLKQKLRIRMMLAAYTLFNINIAGGNKNDYKDLEDIVLDYIDDVYRHTCGMKKDCDEKIDIDCRYEMIDGRLGFVLTNGFMFFALDERFKNMEIYKILELNSSINKKDKSVMERMVKNTDFSKMETDDFILLMLDPESKLNFMICQNISSLFRSTEYSVDETAFILFDGLTKVIIKSDADMMKYRKETKESFVETFRTVNDEMNRSTSSLEKLSMDSFR